MIEDIYTVTSLTRDGQTSRTWGWYLSVSEAREVVLKNDGDIHECLYTFALVERVPWGGMPICEQDSWYAWTGSSQNGRWVDCPKPEWAEGVINYSMG